MSTSQHSYNIILTICSFTSRRHSYLSNSDQHYLNISFVYIVNNTFDPCMCITFTSLVVTFCLSMQHRKDYTTEGLILIVISNLVSILASLRISPDFANTCFTVCLILMRVRHVLNSPIFNRNQYNLSKNKSVTI